MTSERGNPTGWIWMFSVKTFYVLFPLKYQNSDIILFFGNTVLNIHTKELLCWRLNNATREMWHLRSSGLKNHITWLWLLVDIPKFPKIPKMSGWSLGKCVLNDAWIKVVLQFTQFGYERDTQEIFIYSLWFWALIWFISVPEPHIKN